MPLPKIIPSDIKDLVLQYHTQFPDLKVCTLARKILSKEKTRYSESQLRHLAAAIIAEGAGQQKDFKIKEPEFILPESLYEEYLPYCLFPSDNKILILNDIHIPFHDSKALLTALKYGRDKNVNTIILNGDIIDLYSESKFNRIPRLRNTKVEIDLTRQFLTMLRERFPKAKIIYKEGNHEFRLKSYLMDKAPELYEVPEIKLDELLKLKQLRIEWIEDKRLIKAGKLYIIHGHEIFSGAGTINVARTIRLKTSENVIFGHFHKTQNDFQTAISGKLVGGWSVGCLCGLNPLYMPINMWNSGFALVEIDDKGFFDVENKIILDGVVK